MRKESRNDIFRILSLAFTALLLLAAVFFLLQLEETRYGLGTESYSGLSVYFLDVGQADAALLLTDGHAMMIDGGNRGDSSLIVSFLRRQGVTHLDVVVCTHAHEDHVGGLAAAVAECSVDTVYAPVTSDETKVFQKFQKHVEEQGCGLTVPQAGDSFYLGDARVQFLSPVAHVEDVNDSSLVLRVDYGETSFLFTGDAERAAELQIVEGGADLSATLLKVGHHGSQSSTSYAFLREVMPQYAVISVGENNSYGLPDEVVLSRLLDAGTVIYRTDQVGTVCCRSDGAEISVSTEKNAAAPLSWDTPAPERSSAVPEGTWYIGNISSGKFHRLTCGGLPTEENSRYFSSREEAVEAGFAPCSRCKP